VFGNVTRDWSPRKGAEAISLAGYPAVGYAMTDPTVSDAIASTLDILASMLGNEHAVLARRLRDARRQVLDEASSGPSDSTIQMLHDVRAGTMGGLSDVTLGSLVDGRWVVDQPRERQFYQLARDLGEYVSTLPLSGDSSSAR
jgi:hypothetical protein